MPSRVCSRSGACATPRMGPTPETRITGLLVMCPFCGTMLQVLPKDNKMVSEDEDIICAELNCRKSFKLKDAQHAKKRS